MKKLRKGREKGKRFLIIMTTFPYRAYFQAESIGSSLFALIVAIGFSIFAALPCFMGYKDKHYNIRRTIQMIFPYIKKEKRSNTSTTNGEASSTNVEECTSSKHRDTEYDTKIFNYIIQEWYLFWLWVLLLGVIITTVVIFWLNFFIERSSTCDMNFDCYPNEPSLDILDEKPLPNCSISEAKCYRFTCNIGNAVGLATGAFAFSWVIASAFLWIIIQLGGNALKKTENNENDCNFPCKCCTSSFSCGACKFLYECSCLKNDWCSCIYVFCVIGFQALLFLSALGLAGFNFYLYYKGKISITCYFEIGTFCILVIVASLMIWCWGFKNHKATIKREQQCQSEIGRENFTLNPQHDLNKATSTSDLGPHDKATNTNKVTAIDTGIIMSDYLVCISGLF